MRSHGKEPAVLLGKCAAQHAGRKFPQDAEHGRGRPVEEACALLPATEDEQMGCGHEVGSGATTGDAEAWHAQTHILNESYIRPIRNCQPMSRSQKMDMIPTSIRPGVDGPLVALGNGNELSARLLPHGDPALIRTPDGRPEEAGEFLAPEFMAAVSFDQTQGLVEFIEHDQASIRTRADLAGGPIRNGEMAQFLGRGGIEPHDVMRRTGADHLWAGGELRRSHYVHGGQRSW